MLPVPGATGEDAGSVKGEADSFATTENTAGEQIPDANEQKKEYVASSMERNRTRVGVGKEVVEEKK